MDPWLEHDEEADHQLELEANDFHPLPGVWAVRLDAPVTWYLVKIKWNRSNIEIEESIPVPA